MGGRKTSRLATNGCVWLWVCPLHWSSDVAIYGAAPKGLGSVEKNEQLGVWELGSLQTVRL